MTNRKSVFYSVLEEIKAMFKKKERKKERAGYIAEGWEGWGGSHGDDYFSKDRSEGGGPWGRLGSRAREQQGPCVACLRTPPNPFEEKGDGQYGRTECEQREGSWSQDRRAGRGHWALPAIARTLL